MPSAWQSPMAHLSRTKADFDAHILANRAIGTGGPSSDVNMPFVVFDTLEAYWTTSRIRQALGDSYQYSNGDVDTIRKRYLRVFSTLVQTKHIDFIHYLIHHPQLDDQHLPFGPKDRLPYKWPFDVAEFKQFYKEQWQFCVPEFERERLMCDPEFEEDCILPIVQKTLLKPGDCASVYKVKLHNRYNHLFGQTYPSGRPTDEFVLKTYDTDNAKAYYENEVRAFKYLMHRAKFVRNMIIFYGCWRQGKSFNILLEFANGGNLLDFFQRTHPPTKEGHITRFWSSLLRIVEPLQRIHELDHHDEGPRVLKGIHQDIKPANILVVTGGDDSEYEVEFKLADLGLSHFKAKVRPGEHARSNDTYGTPMYSAPECCRIGILKESDLNVTSAIDIWSLGCVLSEAAAWVVLGEHGRDTYASLRRSEITPKFAAAGYSDCFHDGRYLLSAVKTMHDRLRRECRRSDHFTEHIVMLIKSMLEAQPTSRCDAAHVLKTVERIIDNIDDHCYPKAFKTVEGPVVQGYKPIQTLVNIPEHAIKTDPRSPTTPSTPAHPTTSSARRTPPQSPPEHFRPLGGPLVHRRTISQTRASPMSQIFDDMAEGLNIYPSPSRQHNTASRQSYINLNSSPTQTSGFGGFPSTSRLSNLSGVNIRQTMPALDPGRDELSTRDSNSHYLQAAFDRTAATASTARVMSDHFTETLPRMPRPKPYLSVEEAHALSSKGSLPKEEILSMLNGRDHVFLIDDSGSMQSSWRSVIHVFQALAYIVKRADPDGLDLYFTSSSTPIKSRHRKELVAAIQRKKLADQCNMKFALGTVLEKFGAELDNSSEKPRSRRSFTPSFIQTKKKNGLSVYVFTDGVWRDNPPPVCGVEEPVRIIVTKLREQHQLDFKVGIQFIRFGNSPVGIERLDILDSRLREYFPDITMDIIDTTRYDGNVMKMLLGAFDRGWDDDEQPEVVIGSQSQGAAAQQNGYYPPSNG